MRAGEFRSRPRRAALLPHWHEVAVVSAAVVVGAACVAAIMIWLAWRYRHQFASDA